jgi:hypothetical protein
MEIRAWALKTLDGTARGCVRRSRNIPLEQLVGLESRFRRNGVLSRDEAVAAILQLSGRPESRSHQIRRSNGRVSSLTLAPATAHLRSHLSSQFHVLLAWGSSFRGATATQTIPGTSGIELPSCDRPSSGPGFLIEIIQILRLHFFECRPNVRSESWPAPFHDGRSRGF